ncbi:MAG: osmoprotectant transport system substrate-binding protein, partial [Solirubrobacteraceae bacterium]|nr:osmoprotectant transport system substrate-binding protein [Solirubrobacteraceae bacterium]
MNRSIASMGLAAVAALSAAVVVAGCGSSSSSSSSSSGSAGAGGPGKGKPSITIGDKNFTEEYILGELYAQALRAKGYSVNLKSNIGSSEIIDKALTTNNIQMYPDYVGTILSVVAHQNNPPHSAATTYQTAKGFEE